LFLLSQLADGRALVDHAANEAASYRSDYGSSVPLKYLTDRVAGYMHAYTLYSAVRPFGTTLMMSTWGKTDGAQLYCVEPSGVVFGYWGYAAGKAQQAAKTEIEKIKMKDMACKDLIKEAAKIIYQVRPRWQTAFCPMATEGQFTLCIPALPSFTSI
jgi:20S proteasome subunit alpha 7